MFPTLPAQHSIRYTPQIVQIYQYDASPVGGRQPLLLIHGLKDEYVRRLHWEKFCKYLNSNPAFKQKFKIYLARYNSLAPEKQTEAAFKPAIEELASTQNRTLFIVALSISGDIVRNAMDDPAVDKSINKVITLGSPFHGSPLFNRDWMFYSLFKRHKWPFCSLDRYLAYSVYFKFHKNMLRDYYWDNFDDQIPNIGYFKFRLPLLVEGNLTPPSKKPDGASSDRNGEKFTAYACYFQNQESIKMSRSRLFTILHGPFSFFYTTIPAHLGNEHAALRLLNYEIAFVIQKQKREPSYLYNDGITPVCSALSLTSDVQTASSEVHIFDPPALKLKSTVRRARLFSNMDHISFLDGYRQIGSPKKLVDQLSPNEKPRHIFDWLLGDILD